MWGLKENMWISQILIKCRPLNSHHNYREKKNLTSKRNTGRFAINLAFLGVDSLWWSCHSLSFFYFLCFDWNASSPHSRVVFIIYCSFVKGFFYNVNSQTPPRPLRSTPCLDLTPWSEFPDVMNGTGRGKHLPLSKIIMQPTHYFHFSITLSDWLRKGK